MVFYDVLNLMEIFVVCAALALCAFPSVSTFLIFCAFLACLESSINRYPKDNIAMKT